MAPKAINYKANSIVFFKGDMGDHVYVLQSGKISLNYLDIQTGQEMSDLVQKGEFFGVKSALGKYTYDETAVVLIDSMVIQFTVDEFEQVVSANTRVIMKMMRVFSNQLRRIHKQVQSLLSNDDQMDPEQGLYSIGEYYFRNKKFSQAAEAFNRYVIYYPVGRFSDDVHRKIKIAETQKVEQAKMNPTERQSTWAEAEALKADKRYKEAYKAYMKFAQARPENHLPAEFEAGFCLYALKSPDECIRHYTNMLKRNPKYSRIGDVLYYIGKSYIMQKETLKAKSFFTKALTLQKEDNPLRRDAQLLLEQIGE